MSETIRYSPWTEPGAAAVTFLPKMTEHPEPSAYARKFSGRYAHRTIKGGIGHNLPQEAPQAFAEAVIEVTEI